MSLMTPIAGFVGKTLMQLAAPGGKRGLSILIYHRVLPHKDPLFPGELDAAEFDAQLGLVKRCCHVMPLLDAVRQMRQGCLPARAACITFDDGYADNAQVALPLLQKHGMHATFFVATGFLNGGRMWNDTIIELVRAAPGPVLDASSIGLGSYPVGSNAERSAAIGALIGKLKYLPMAVRLAEVNTLATALGLRLPDNLMMTTAQVQQLHGAGMAIGGHTVNHPILARLEVAEARREMMEGKAALEAMTGEPVRLFAYPNGKPREDYLAEHVALARELGFEAAVSTAWGGRREPADVYQLPRFTPWDRDPLRFVVRLARNFRTVAERV